MAEDKPKKRNAPSNIVLIAAVVVALVGMGVINTINQKTTASQTQDEHQDENKPAEEQTKQPPQPVASATNGPGATELAGYGEEKVLGKTDSKKEITIVWEWTPEVQGDPGKVYNGIQAAVEGASDAKIRVVNADARPNMKPGLYINGQFKLPPQADGSFPPVQQAYRQMLEQASAPPGGAVPPPGAVPPGAASPPGPAASSGTAPAPGAPAAAPSPGAKP